MRQTIRRNVIKCEVNSNRSRIDNFQRVEQRRAKVLRIAKNTIVKARLPDKIIIIAGSHRQPFTSFRKQKCRVPGHICIKYELESGIRLFISFAHKCEPAIKLKLVQYPNRLRDFLLL